jgi:hypothetical protein
LLPAPRIVPATGVYVNVPATLCSVPPTVHEEVASSCVPLSSLLKISS